MIAAVLGGIADICCVLGLLMSVWSVSCREPRLMSGALGLSALSMVYYAGAEAYRGRYEAVVLGGIGVALVITVMWRCWPEGWNPYREFRHAVLPGRLNIFIW